MYDWIKPLHEFVGPIYPNAGEAQLKKISRYLSCVRLCQLADLA